MFALAALAAVHYATDLAGKIILGLILGVLLTAGVRALRIGGHHADVISLAAAATAVYWHDGLSLVPLCIALGAAAHIAGDELTRDGCPLAWPVSGHEFHLLPHRLQITAGRFAEHWIISTLLLAGLGYLVWRDTGMAGVVHHLDTMDRTGTFWLSTSTRRVLQRAVLYGRLQRHRGVHELQQRPDQRRSGRHCDGGGDFPGA